MVRAGETITGEAEEIAEGFGTIMGSPSNKKGDCPGSLRIWVAVPFFIGGPPIISYLKKDSTTTAAVVSLTPANPSPAQFIARGDFSEGDRMIFLRHH